MNVDKIRNEVYLLEEQCEPFLTIANLEKEELKELETAPNTLQIKAFDEIVKECKKEATLASAKKMSHFLELLYDIKTEPFDPKNINQAMEELTNRQLKNNSVGITSDDIENMIAITRNITQVLNTLAAEYKTLKKRAKKWYVFNDNKQQVIASLIHKLTELRSKLRVQMEYDAKKLAEVIIEDFYNIYIFFSYLIHFSILHDKQLLSIEIANHLDKYIKIIMPIFNNRSLKSQDMLYHYVLYELKELKITIFESISTNYNKELI